MLACVHTHLNNLSAGQGMWLCENKLPEIHDQIVHWKSWCDYMVLPGGICKCLMYPSAIFEVSFRYCIGSNSHFLLYLPSLANMLAKRGM